MFDFLNPVDAALSGPMFSDIRLAIMAVIAVALVVCGLRWILSAIGLRPDPQGGEDD